MTRGYLIMIMKSNEIEVSDEQLDRLAEVWPRLTPAVRRSILQLVEGAARIQQLNHGAGGVRPRRASKLLLENHNDYDTTGATIDETESTIH